MLYLCLSQNITVIKYPSEMIFYIPPSLLPFMSKHSHLRNQGEMLILLNLHILWDQTSRSFKVVTEIEFEGCMQGTLVASEGVV